MVLRLGQSLEVDVLSQMSWDTAILGVLAATASALTAICYLLFLDVWKNERDSEEDERISAAFLFEGPDLVDTDPAAEEIFSNTDDTGSDWARIMSAIAPLFPGAQSRLELLTPAASVSLHSMVDNSRLLAKCIDGRIRLALVEKTQNPNHSTENIVTQHKLAKEVEALRAATDNLPYLAWRLSSKGEITWANAAYVETVRAKLDPEAELEHPLPPIFGGEAMAEILRDGSTRRQCIRNKLTGEELWFECSATALESDALFFSIPINAAVNAERQLREFMQTLTKTFSHLTTGLAIFDKQRRLTLFNPALTDLTSLPVDFLAARPTFFSVLDHLRDRRMMPEPKDYAAWRRQISDLEAAAADGTYSETWSLADGRTFRVTGRPHPGGALAFVLEDITAEISMTRRFRSELELGQAVIDTMDTALIVFSPTGTVSMANRAYQDLWGNEIIEAISSPSITDLSRDWMARCNTTKLWGEIRDFVLNDTERTTWGDTITLATGEALDVTIRPVAGGSTLVGFERLDVAERPRETAQKSA